MAINRSTIIYAGLIGTLFALEAAYVLERWDAQPASEVEASALGQPKAIVEPTSGADQSGAASTASAPSAGTPAPAVASVGGEETWRDSRGAELDRRFVETLIKRYHETVTMAEVVQARGANPEVRRLAAGLAESRKRDLLSLQRYHTAGN